MSHKKSKRVLTSKDFDILKDLWTWKILSTHSIAKKYYPKTHPFAAYVRLTKLQSHRFIKFIQLSMGGAWTLDSKGYTQIFPYLSELSQKGFKIENPVHDFFASAFHLGEWLAAKPNGAEFCSEQELRRVNYELLPHWVPKSFSHRPDGYSLIKSNNKSFILAFETELTQKTKSRYEQTLNFYEGETSINAVFWLVPSSHQHAVIKNLLKELAYTRTDMHNFIYFEDFKRRGWFSTIQDGKYKNMQLASILFYKAITPPLQNFSESNTASLLNNQKRPSLPSDYKKPPSPKSLD